MKNFQVLNGLVSLLLITSCVQAYSVKIKYQLKDKNLKDSWSVSAEESQYTTTLEEHASTDSNINTQALFEFDFDSLNDEYPDEIEGSANIDNQLPIRFPQSYLYKTIDARDILLTDWTSISKPTLNNDKCHIPFDFGGVENNFCVDNNGEIECDTGNGNFGKCTLGRYLIFKPFIAFGDPVNLFRSNIEFTTYIDLASKVTYDFSFYFLINTDSCPLEETRLSLFLVDDEFFFQDLFASNDTSVELKPNQWNLYEKCFTVLSGAYKFNILAENLCDNDKVFLALDDILIKKSNKPENECLNIQITQKPETTTKLTTVLPSTEPPIVATIESEITTQASQPASSTDEINTDKSTSRIITLPTTTLTPTGQINETSTIITRSTLLPTDGITDSTTNTLESISTTKDSITTTVESVSTTKDSITTTTESISTTRDSITTTAESISTSKDSITKTTGETTTTKRSEFFDFINDIPMYGYFIFGIVVFILLVIIVIILIVICCKVANAKKHKIHPTSNNNILLSESEL